MSSNSSDAEIGSPSLSDSFSPPSSVPPSPYSHAVELPDTLRDSGNRCLMSFKWPRGFPTLPKHEVPLKTAEADATTPDRWVKRNSELIRLTGKHPFNCEAPLRRLFDAGFLTPPHLFYVRNHGAVPQVDQHQANTWRLRIHGLVKNELSFSIQDLQRSFPVVTLPTTLVCAGNRRKEQNMVRQSLGFNWGAAAVSTALFTGVYLSDLLAVAKPIRPRAKHVIFEGVDVLPNGVYGTSQRLSWAADPAKGMLISWAMNGAPLEPDHGFPLRVVVPGQIGGRSVKWLNSIEVSERESQHHLHFWDNKVLPSKVTAEEARSVKAWWYDPKYIINELNVNSAIAHPDHNETISLRGSNALNPSVNDASRSYRLAGYAYAGGGRRVNRVEISLDAGRTWKLASIEYPEDQFREQAFEVEAFGKLDVTEIDSCFCWCFWEHIVPFDDLEASGAIMVRAMDESLVLQQRDMYWNATGMMNNWWFRVSIHRFDEGGETKLRFEHPTLAGATSGGWMEAEGSDPRNPVFGNKSSAGDVESEVASKVEEKPMIRKDITRVITWSEIKDQDRSKPWFVVKGNVYDGTAFLKEHPGGPDSILLAASDDATEDFLAIHSPEGRARLAEFHIGILATSNGLEPAVLVDDGNKLDDASSFLHNKTWKSIKLVSRIPVSHDAAIFRFELPNSTQKLGLPSGQHVFVRLPDKDGRMVQRAYTPLSDLKSEGYIEILVKLYRPCKDFPTGGKMSSLFDKLDVGHEIQMKGPLGSFTWLGKGEALWRQGQVKPGAIGLICGGSGVTPILQVIRAIIQDKEDTTTKISVLTSNKTEEDILCREEMDSYVSFTSGRYQIHHALTRIPSSNSSWKGSRGRLSEEMLRKHLPPISDGTLILTCGPDGMIETIKTCLTNIGWDIERSLVIF